MFAGPNGSGKSTLIKEIKNKFSVGFYVNADDIEKELSVSKFIDCNNYLPILVNQKDWNYFKSIISSNDTRVTSKILDSIEIKNGILTNKSETNSYIAAVIVEFLRQILLQNNSSFSFETVMSHVSKVDFIKKAKDKGFKTYLYFISTQDPLININRVKIRVSKGGHTVDQEKIVKRYYHSLELLSQAFLIADRAFIFDNSTDDETQNLLIEKKGDNVEVFVDEIPEWMQLYLIDKLNIE
jgi:predicted ABC-type ATPase